MGHNASIGRVPVCPVCGSTGVKPLCETDGFKVWRCAKSATDFVWPMPDERNLETLYDRASWFEAGEKGGYQNYDQQTQAVLPLFHDLLARHTASGAGQSLLDVGCGYGTHLGIAAERGWKCFGVEVSSHARKVAKERHGDRIYVTDRVENLIPHQFDLILLLDVLEHVKDPYQLFFALFSRGAITPETKIVVTTPNARSSDAVGDPEHWIYRHPPSHLVYYSAESLRHVFTKLHFGRVQVSGIHPGSANTNARFGDEDFSINDDLREYAGLLCEAEGSNFQEFMHERYVPGTWSKITEYEHLPRYIFAKTFAAHDRVLDFGCGTGYGSATLAEVAQSVLGLDIDSRALDWARQEHNVPNLHFEHHDDLGRALPDRSFDLITCFEVIEHVDEATQQELIQNFARLLTAGGRLLISTPNPQVTINYGENPYHLREMTEEEFGTLMKSSFRHVEVLKQWIRPSVTIAAKPDPGGSPNFYNAIDASHRPPLPANYVAICSHEPLSSANALCYFDSSFDYIASTLGTERRIHEWQMEALSAQELAHAREQTEAALKNNIAELQHELSGLNQELENERGVLAELRQENETKQGALATSQAQIASLQAELLALRRTKIHRLHDAVHQPFSVRKFVRIAYLVAAMATPSFVKQFLRPWIIKIKLRLASRAAADQPTSAQTHTIPEAPPSTPFYQVRIAHPARENRPRIAHAIANFMTGGSSRLVVDLIENLGHLYEQEVITSCNPENYRGLAITEFRQLPSPKPICDYLSRFQPSLLHVHYWGECDKSWYEQVFEAAAKVGCRIIENVNTPVDPYVSRAVERYVYVSDYVRESFAVPDGDTSATIHPGTDFKMFNANGDSLPAQECIGMVYRLEPDKLNAQSIDVFIKVAQRRPQTKILIVGGGTFLNAYMEAVRAGGVLQNFNFTGYVAYEDLPALYKRMTVFVAPVWKESFGQVSSMAMNLRIPVVGYDVGGLSEIINDPALLAPPGDSNRLADIIITLLDDRARCKSIGLKNQLRAQALFSLETMIAKYEELYADILGRNS